MAMSPAKIGAEVTGFDLDSYVESGRVLARHTPRPSQMALAAALLALHDAELDVNLMSESMGVYVGTSLGNLETTFAMRDRLTGGRPDRPLLLDIGPKATHVGENGLAVSMKIAVNLSLAV